MFFFEDPERVRDPFPSYAYHREHEPLTYYAPGRTWIVFRYDDVDRLLHDERLSNRRASGVFDTAPEAWRQRLHVLKPIFEAWMLMRDGQEHMRLRRAFQAFFAERSVAALEPRIQAAVDELIAPLERDGAMDWAAELAYQLPVRVISDLLRVHPADRGRVVQWSDHLSEFFNNVPPSEEHCENVLRSTMEMVGYMRSALQDARRNPGEDLLSQVVDLDEDDLIANAVVLLVAGHETTRCLIGSCISLLLRHPDQLQLLRERPELLSHAVEESLRMEPANPIMGRVAQASIDLHGQTIQPGHLVLLGLGSANRDSAHFPEGDRFDVSRKPGKHLAFGSGPHYCLGSLLARKEIMLSVGALLRRFPQFRAHPEHPEQWLCLPGIRGPQSLKILAA